MTENLQELSLEEMDEVGGGLVFLGTSMALGGVFWAKFFAGTAMAGVAGGTGLSAASQATKKKKSYPSGGFGSDRRIKREVRKEGHIDALGLDVYSWEYVGAPGERFVGVMAQDLLARPDLAHTVFTFHDGPFEGYYGVDYSALGLRCIPEEAFDGKVETIFALDVADA